MTDDRKHKFRGIAGTLVFHMIIVMILLFLGFSTPLPLPGDEGVEVNLGSSEMGLGDFQPEEPARSMPATPPPAKVEKVDEEVVTQDTEEAPAVEESKETTQEEQAVEPVEEQEVVEKAPEVNPAALYKGKSNQAAENTSEGIAGGEGDQGATGGDKESKNYLGKGGFGDGPDWSLAGRTPRYLPKPSSTFTENGTVAVQITVNKFGKVVKAIAVDRGSNTTNAKLRKLAEQAALKAEFNAKLDAAELQRGTITYHFIIKN